MVNILDYDFQTRQYIELQHMALVSLTIALSPARDRKTLGSGAIPPYHLQSEQSTYIW